MKNLVEGLCGSVVGGRVHCVVSVCGAVFGGGRHFERRCEEVHCRGEVASVEGCAVEKARAAFALRVCAWGDEHGNYVR